MNKDDYTKMVAGLMKSGGIMKAEWTNKEKEQLLIISGCLDFAASMWGDVITTFPLYDDPNDYELNHMMLGLVGELGEFLDAHKKAIVYRKPLDNKNIKEELGDITFYAVGINITINKNPLKYSDLQMRYMELSKLLTVLFTISDTTVAECMQLNYDKLSERYKNHQYTDAQAKERNDKNHFVDVTLLIAGENLILSFFPDVPKVCWQSTEDIVEEFETQCGKKFDQELLIQICKSKIEKEGN